MQARTYTTEKPYECKQCGKAYMCQSALQTHQRIHTGEKSCEYQQGKSFSSPLGFQTHERAHTGEEPYAHKEYERALTCYQKFEGMKEKFMERSHMNVRNVGKPSDVIRCYQSFQIHERNPTAQKPFECEECGVAYRYSIFQRHRKTSRREPPGM